MADREDTGAAPSERARLVFVVLLVAWMAFPLLLWGRLAQDAVPLITAGSLVRDHPDAVYSDPRTTSHDVNPAFLAKACSEMPAGTDCDQVVVPFSHPPVALPFAWLVGVLGPDLGALVCRLIAAGGLAGGMAVLWRRLARRSARMPAALAGAAVLLTPYALFTITLGQSSALLFLSACLGVAIAEHNAGALKVALVWVATVALKLFPAALVAVLLWQRRWRVLAWGALVGGALVVLTLAIAPTSVLRPFLDSTRALRLVSFDDPYNRGIDGIVHVFVPSWNGDSTAFYLSLAVRVALVAVLWFVRVRLLDDDQQWAYGWVAVLLLVPLVWWHYLWVVVAAMVLAAGSRARDDDRWVWLVVGVSAVTVPLTFLDLQSAASTLVQGAFFLVGLIGIPFLARPMEGPPQRVR